MSKSYFFIFIPFLILLGCKDEQDLPEPKPSPTEFSVNLRIEPIVLKGNTWVQFVLADNDGKILDVEKYEEGASQLTLSSIVGTANSTANVFRISGSERIEDNKYEVMGFLGLKNGTEWVIKSLPPYGGPMNFSLVGNFKNIPSFAKTNISTNLGWFYRDAPGNYRRENMQYVAGTKLLIQVEKKDEAFYKFFDIDEANNIVNADVSECTTPSEKKTIRMMENAVNQGFYLMGKPSLKYLEKYLLIENMSLESEFNVFYPPGFFERISSVAKYTVPGSNYLFETRYNNSIPDEVRPYKASINVNTRSLTGFQSTLSGTVDFYISTFNNVKAKGQNVTIPLILYRIYAPGKVTSFKIPDFSQIHQALNTNNPDITLTRVELINTQIPNVDYFSYLTQFSESPIEEMARLNF